MTSKGQWYGILTPAAAYRLGVSEDAPCVVTYDIAADDPKIASDVWLNGRRVGGIVKIGARGIIPSALQEGGKDWNTPCSNCGELPTMHPTELCGPCCTGEADTYGGNW